VSRAPRALGGPPSRAWRRGLPLCLSLACLAGCAPSVTTREVKGPVRRTLTPRDDAPLLRAVGRLRGDVLAGEVVLAEVCVEEESREVTVETVTSNPSAVTYGAVGLGLGLALVGAGLGTVVHGTSLSQAPCVPTEGEARCTSERDRALMAGVITLIIGGVASGGSIFAVASGPAERVERGKPERRVTGGGRDVACGRPRDLEGLELGYRGLSLRALVDRDGRFELELPRAHEGKTLTLEVVTAPAALRERVPRGFVLGVVDL
jgi:hypothetical protein